MNVSSFAFVTQTPDKDENVPVESADNEEELSQKCMKLSLSEPLRKGLLSIDRLHTFVHSNNIKKIEDMQLNIAERNVIRDLFAGFDEDIRDWMIKLEEQSINTNVYSAFIRDYISYEFLVQKEHSFSVLILLNYSKLFKITPETAFGEMFNISMKDTFCSNCDLIKSKPNDFNLHVSNVAYLKRKLNDDCESFDDSIRDPDYSQESADESESDGCDSPSSVQKKQGQLSKIGNVSQLPISVNPFEDSDEDVYEFTEVISVNPFESEALGDEYKTAGNENFKPQKMSSLKNDEESSRQCSICEKTFGNKYNLKVHLVQVHRKSVPNMTVYHCPLCDFVTASKICLERHRVTHSKTKKKSGYEAVCSICYEKFANSSSLRRHKNRKH